MQRQSGQIVRNADKTDRKQSKTYEIYTVKTENSPRRDIDHKYLSEMLRQGTKYIFTRYQHDLEKLEEMIDGKETMPQFQSDSKDIFSRLASKIQNRKPVKQLEISNIVRKQHTLLLKQLQKMAQKTQAITIELSNSLALNGLLTQTVHRLQISQQQQMKINNFYKSFVNAYSTYCQMSNKIKKIRKIVIAIQFTKRIKKCYASSRRQRQNSGWINKLQSLENVQTMRKLKKSLNIPEVYSPTGQTIRKILRKLSIEDSLMKLIDGRSIVGIANKYPIAMIKLNKVVESMELQEQLLRLNVRVKTIYQNII